MLFEYDETWTLEKSPAEHIGGHLPTKLKRTWPDPEDPSIKVPTMMTTADMAMIRDPEYRKISNTSTKILMTLLMHFRRHGSNFYTETWD